jgi:hypothetical protein
MFQYKIGLINENINSIYINDKLVGYLKKEEIIGYTFVSIDENISIYLDNDVCEKILSSTKKSYKVYENYINNQSWENFYKMIVYIIVYLNRIRMIKENYLNNKELINLYKLIEKK